MKCKLFNRALAALLSLMLIVSFLPITAFADDSVENTAPKLEDFATVDQLRTEFDMDDSTDKLFKMIYFGNKTWQWSIVGVDPVGDGLVLLFQNSMPWSYFSSSADMKDYDPAWNIVYEDGFVPEKVAPNHYGASDMRTVFQSYTESGNSACLFTDAQLDMIIPTTIYTADFYNEDDDGNPRIYHSSELLYPTYSTDYKPASEGRIQFVTVGSNSADELGTQLKVDLMSGNVSSSFTRSAHSDYDDYVLSNSNLGVDSRWAEDDRCSYLPVFQMDTSDVLFGSIYKGVTAPGEQKDTYGQKIYTLRMKADDLGKAYVTNTAQEYVTIEDAPEGTYLVAQSGEGAWAAAVSGDTVLWAADMSDGAITSFENCKVWLEKTETQTNMTRATMAETTLAYSVEITGNEKLIWDENSGKENQVSLENAPITDIVYHAVEDYYFPEGYSDALSQSGITVTRTSDTQITISGMPTDNVYITLPLPEYGGDKDKWDGVTVATSYESGDGTEGSPYVIANAEQFAYFAQQLTAGVGIDAYYELTADLEMTSANWKTIPMFEGHFDGNGHTVVYTLKDTIQSSFSCYGLFGEVYGTIYDLKVSGDILLSSPRMMQYVYIGGLCGYLGGTITHCGSDVEIRCDTDPIVMRPMIGGITGSMDGGIVEYSSYSGFVQWEATAANNSSVIAGGIVGEIYDGAIRQCFNRGSLTVNCYSTAYVGGIAGHIYTWDTPVTTTIDNSYNMGNISSACINNKAYAGGISGYLDAYFKDTGSSVNGCYSTGTLASSTGDVSHLAPVVNEFELKDNYCLEDEDANVQQVVDKTELFENLNTYAPNTWFSDSQTSDVRLLWELNVPAVPETVFNADSENGGLLSNAVAGMMYSVDGGHTWAEMTDTTAAITGVTVEKGIQIYLPGDFHETNDSPVQTIAITKAAAPTTPGANGCTTTEQNDGMITGVDSTMEYKAEGADAWITITGESVTELKPGNYLVRVKADGTALASATATVIVQAHICTAQEDWQHDENGHWKLCACGEKLAVADHTFEWVTDKEATATQTGAKHEECTVCGYAKATVEISATGTSTVPGTGDDSNVILWLAWLLAAGAALTGTAVYSHKRKYSK